MENRTRDTVILIFALAAMLAVICMRGAFGLKTMARPAIADNEEMQRTGDDWIVGDSNVSPDPVSRVALANTRFGPLPGMRPLRQVTRGGIVHAQIDNEAPHG